MMWMAQMIFLGIPEVGLIDHRDLIDNPEGLIGIISERGLKEISIMLINNSQSKSKNNKKT